MLTALLIAAVIGIVAGLIVNAFDRTRRYAGVVGLGVGVLVFIIKLGLFPEL